jgi:PAS domain S-box-containing protein
MVVASPNILIVEDEKIIAKGIERRLKGLGYRVCGVADNGEEAIAKARELCPDIILMDIHLGVGLDGVEAAARIRSERPVPIIYLTAHSDDATLQRAKVTEPSGFILKPYEDKDLQTALEIGIYKHKMETRLREHEQWLQATLASIGDGVIATDAGGRVQFMNSLAEQLTGWTHPEAIGKNVEEVFPIVDATHHQPVRNPALEAIEKGRAVNLPVDTILLHRSGVEYPVDDSAAPIRDVHGRVAGSVLVFRDVTERLLATQALQQSEANFRRLVTVAPLGVAVCRKTRVIFVNAALLNIFGYPDSFHVVGVDFLKLVHPEGMEAAQRILAHDQEGSRGEVVALQARNGSKLQVEVTSMPVDFDGAPSSLLLLRDLG